MSDPAIAGGTLNRLKRQLKGALRFHPENMFAFNTLETLERVGQKVNRKVRTNHVEKKVTG